MNNIYGVVFSTGGKVYHFTAKHDYTINTTVIVETEKGEQFGKIVNVSKNNNQKEHKEIKRKTTKEDYDNHLKNLKDADRALKTCKDLAAELNLKMNFISAAFTFNRNQLVFNFYADERIDFRELAKRLAFLYKTRIELRQIGARDKAREVCGVGVCGQKLCCSRFLNQMESVSITMAKNQGIALNPNKINGSCNRLLCCLSYEDDTYTENRKELPHIGQKIKVENKEGIVKSLNILDKKYIVEVDKERIEIDAAKNNKK